MVTFSQTLRDFQAGTAVESDVVERLEVSLKDPLADPDSLLDILDRHHAKTPLPDGLLQHLRHRLNQAARVLATGSGEPADETRLATRFAPDATSDTGTGPALPDDEATMFGPPVTPESLGHRAAEVGDTLNGRFYLEAMIGEGGMSLVFKAVDRLRERAESRNPYVAVKVLDVVGPSERDAYIALQREAQKSQTLNHPHIVRVHDFHQDGDVVYMTMEYLSGVPLSRKIKQMGEGGLPHDVAMRYINQMGEALVHAHSHRILHADFKPSNVFITDTDAIKVIDFGIARAFRLPEDQDESKTLFQVEKLGALTPMYASAEMIENADPDPRDDVYSLGCVAYELLTGRHPFARAKATAARDAQLQVNRPRGLGSRQWRALQRALAFDRESRTPSVRAFLDELNASDSTGRTLLLGFVVAAAVAGGIGLWVTGGPEPAPTPPAPEVAPEIAPTVVPEPVAEPVEVAPPPPPPGTVIQDCPTCPRVVVLPAGDATIGADLADVPHVFEAPPHQVVLAQPFALGITEVTREQFASYVDDTGAELTGCRTVESQWRVDSSLSWSDPGFAQGADHPVTCVSWLDAQAYVAWLSRRTGETYRLPSESEWEYASLGPDAAAWPNPPEETCAGANVADAAAAEAYPGLTVFPCDDGFAHTAPAATGAAAGYGLQAMQGNLFEWTQDCWNSSYRNASGDGTALEMGDCNKRVLRGGSWFTAPAELRLTFRNRSDASYRSNTFGFRVLREVTQ